MRRCGEGALATLECIERAKLGKPVLRIGASVARTYRDAVMKLQAENRNLVKRYRSDDN